MGMKLVRTTFSTLTILFLVACNKTENANKTMGMAEPTELDVEVEVDGGEIVVFVNGEQQDVDISEILGGLDMDTLGGEVEIHMIVEGDEMDGMPKDMMGHVMQKIGERQHSDVDVSFDWTTAPPRVVREHKMRGQEGHDGKHEVHVQMMRTHRGDEAHGEWRQDRDIPEELQFMQELGILGEVSEALQESDSVALMGIHMIRDELEGEARFGALDEIIEETPHGSAIRNAALIVGIQTMLELGDIEAASDLMVDLVLSN